MIMYDDGRREDASALDVMASRAWKQAYANRFPARDIAAYCHLNFGRQGLAGTIGARDVHFRLARAEGMIVGYAKLKRLAMPVSEPDPGALELERLYVSRPWEGCGIGRTLLDWAIDLASATSVPLYLAVFDFNWRARKMYTRRGFVEVGSMPVPVGARVEQDLIWRMDCGEASVARPPVSDSGGP